MTLTQQLNQIRALCLENGIENQSSIVEMVREMIVEKEKTVDSCLAALKISNDKVKAGAKP